MRKQSAWIKELCGDETLIWVNPLQSSSLWHLTFRSSIPYGVNRLIIIRIYAVVYNICTYFHWRTERKYLVLVLLCNVPLVIGYTGTGIMYRLLRLERKYARFWSIFLAWIVSSRSETLKWKSLRQSCQSEETLQLFFRLSLVRYNSRANSVAFFYVSTVGKWMARALNFFPHFLGLPPPPIIINADWTG